MDVRDNLQGVWKKYILTVENKDGSSLYS
jgi:hypothetical protein